MDEKTLRKTMLEKGELTPNDGELTRTLAHAEGVVPRDTPRGMRGILPPTPCSPERERERYGQADNPRLTALITDSRLLLQSPFSSTGQRRT